MIAPFDRAVSHEESLTMRTEANVEEQAKVVHNLQRIRDGSIEESRSRLKQEEQIFLHGCHRYRRYPSGLLPALLHQEEMNSLMVDTARQT